MRSFLRLWNRVGAPLASGDLNLEKRVEDVAGPGCAEIRKCFVRGNAWLIQRLPSPLPGLEKQHQGVAGAAVAKELCLLWLPDPNDQDPPLGVLDDWLFLTYHPALIVCDDELKLGAERLNAAKANFTTR